MTPNPANKNNPINLKSGLWAVIVICLLGLLLYSNTFSNPFLFDDNDNITRNFSIRNLANIPAIWNIDPTHFILYLSLALNYYFHELHVFGYHLVNLIIHVCTALMVWWLVKLSFSTPYLKENNLVKYKQEIALFSSLLFVCHPIQTEAVTYMIQRGTSLAAFFYISSLTLYIKARLITINKPERKYWLGYYGLSLLTAILGMFSKQIVITLPIMIILYEFCFLRSKSSSTARPDFKYKYLIPYLVLIFLVPLNTMFSKKISFLEINQLTRECDIISRSQYLLTQFRVIVTYLRLVFLPLNQNIDYDYPVYQSLWQMPVIVSFLFLSALLVTGILIFNCKRIISFSIFWFFLTLSVESSFIPIRDIIFEHRLYLPMVSYSIFLPICLYYLCSPRNLKMARAILVILVLFYSSLTYPRNSVWKNEFNLWNDAALKSPNKARPFANRGKIYIQNNLLEKGIADYTHVLTIRPDSMEAYNNRGVAYMAQKKYTKAIADFSQAVKIAPALVDGYYNRGNVYLEKEDYNQAIADYSKVLEKIPDHILASNNRGYCYYKKGDYDKALADYNLALTINPADTRVLANRAKLKNISPHTADKKE